jgi:ABC-type glycerol-3-phosphate transport system substrate-binding protein
MKRFQLRKGERILAKEKRTVFLFACVMLFLSACSMPQSQLKDNGDNLQKPESQELKLMLFGDKPTDMDLVLQEFERRTNESLGLKLNIEWNALEEYRQKLKLRLTAGEEVDAVFDAQWLSLEQNVAQGYYQKLDNYFNNDDYPGLKKAFPPDYLETNKFNGHLYSVPLTQLFYDIELVYIRKDLRERLGLGPIKSYADLEAYLQAVDIAYPEMIPFALKGDRGFFKLFSNEDMQTHVRMAPHMISGAGAGFQVVLSKDGKRVLGAVTYGDPKSAYEAFPAPFNDPDYFYGSFDRYVSWNKYIQKDVLNERNPLLLFVAGKSAAFEDVLSGWERIRQKLITSIPGAELEGFVYSSCQRKMENGCIGTDYRTWNNLAIPVTSKHADETMKFIDWLFQSQENHDLFELGIEGEHWMEAGSEMYKPMSAATNYQFPRYELTWNPTMSRINADNVPEAVELMRYSADPKTYYRLPLAGFRFNPSPVKTEIAKVQPVWEQTAQVFRSGLDPDWRTTAAKTNLKLRNLGLENIRSELIKQIQAYLDAGGS